MVWARQKKTSSTAASGYVLNRVRVRVGFFDLGLAMGPDFQWRCQLVEELSGLGCNDMGLAKMCCIEI